jgi:NAD(P)-dependent dehydrogenase (short-subunit alcohol dehydrogenase family)
LLDQPDEIAEAIAFLAGSRWNYMTGSELYVDGAWPAQ